MSCLISSVFNKILSFSGIKGRAPEGNRDDFYIKKLQKYKSR